MFKVLKVLFGLITFIILALLAAPFFIDVNDYKPEISKVVYDATGRNVNIEHIQISAFPWVGLTLKNVQLENAPGFQHQHMLTIDTVDVQLALIPLLNDQIEVKRFLLDTPKVWLEQRSDASNNWQDLQASKNAKTDTSASPQPIPQSTTQKQTAANNASSALSSPIALTAELLQLKHGQVTWSDAMTGEVAISDIQLDIRDLQLSKPIQVALSAKLEQNPFELTAEIGPIGDFNSLDITKLPVRMQFKTDGFSLAPLSAWLPTLDKTQTKQFGNLKTAKANLDVSIEQHKDSAIVSNGSLQVQLKDTLNMTWKINSKALKSIHIQALDVALNDTSVIDISGNIKNLNQSPSYELRIETPKLQRIWLNHFVPTLQTLYQHHPEPWQSIKLGALIAGDADILDIRDLQVQLNDEHIQASGNLALGKAPDIQLRITTNTLHLDPWIPQSEAKPKVQTTSQKTTATPTAVKAIEPNLTFLRPWYLSLQLSAKRIDAIGLQLDNLRLTLSSEKGVLRLNPLKFEISGGRVSENFTLYANTYPATWKESMKLSDVSVQPILKAVADFEKLSGTAELSTSLSGKGLLPSNITKSLNGNGHFVFEDGQFEGVDIAKEVRKFKKQDSPSQNTTDFAQMQGSFRVNKGVLSNNDLYMASPLFRLTGKGKLYLDPLKIDYHVRPRLIESLAGQGGSRIDRGIEVPLHISGPLDNIQVSVEMDKDALINSAAAINNAAGKPIGGVGGKVLDQGYVKTRDEQVAKAKAEAKRKADAKIAAEKARLEAAAKKKAEEKLKDMFKGFGF